MVRPLLALALSGLLLATPCRADDAETFESLLEKTTVAQIEAIQDYVSRNPDAEDAEEAYVWLFQTARLEDREELVRDSADAYLSLPEEEADESVALLARAVRCLARVRSGEHEDAIADFKGVVEQIPVRAGTSAVSVAIDLANALQIAGEIELARGVYEEMETTYFLNREVQQYVGSRLKKLDLVGDVPPPLEIDDLEGEAIDFSAYEGKVVILDFWATNCGPCIEMLPRLKRMHRELQPEGLEIVGLSLDDSTEIVREFTREREIPWRMAMATDDGAQPIFTYHAQVIPTLYVVGRDGKIVASDLRGEMLEKLVRRQLAAKE